MQHLLTFSNKKCNVHLERYIYKKIIQNPTKRRQNLSKSVLSGNGHFSYIFLQSNDFFADRRSSSRVPFWNRIRGHPDSQGAQKVKDYFFLRFHFPKDFPLFQIKFFNCLRAMIFKTISSRFSWMLFCQVN